MQYLLILFALLVALPAYGQTQIPASKVTGIPAQLEEGGNQEMDVEGLPTSCAENQIPKADATGGLVCAADEDSGAGSGGATDTVAADTGGAATGADILIEGGTNIDTTRSVDTITIDHDGVATSATLLLNNADLRWDASAFCYFYDWNNNTTKDNGDFCLTHQDFYASDYTTGSTTGGIQEAFDAAVPNANGSIGVIHLPCGTTTITTPLVFGNAQVAGDRPGFILKGCGSVKPTNVGSGPRGTTIVWDDAATDTDGDGKEVMIRVSSRHWKMQDFTLIGDEGNSDTSGFATTAFHGILWRADNEDSQVNTVSHLENVYMWDFEGSSHFYDGCRDAAGTLCDETDAANQPDGYKGQSDQVHIYGGGAAFSRSCGEIVADGAQHISYDSFECWSPDYASFILNASGSMTLRNIAGTMQGDDTNHPNHSQAGGQYAAVLITPAADNFNVDISSNTRFEQAGMHGIVVSGFCSEDSGLTPQDRTPCIFDDECGGTCSFSQVGVGGSLNISGVSLSMGKTGEHDAAGSTTVLTDADANFPQSPNSFESRVIYNVTDGESCTITASTATTLTCAGLSGGASWDSGDDYHVGERYALYANMEGVLGFNGSTFGLAGAQPANTTVQISNDTADGELAYVGNKTNFPGGVVMNFDANVERTLLHTSASEISALTAKGSPVSGDFLLIEDSAAGNVKRSITIGDLPGGGSNIVLDLLDDDANESTALGEIAITGDTNSIFTEPTDDKLLIAAANNWPTADSADAVGDDAVGQIADVAAGIKRGPDATDTHLLTTDVAAPVGSAECLEMDTDGSVILAGGACGVAGGDDITAQAAFGDPVNPIFNDTASVAVDTTDAAPDTITWTVLPAGITVGGEVSGTADSVTVTDDGHNHTTTTLSGILDADIGAGAAIAISKTALVDGTNITLTTNTLNVDDAFLVNDASDVMAGTLTADGLTLGANENITLGAQTLDHDGTDFVFDDAVRAPSFTTDPAATPTLNFDDSIAADTGEESRITGDAVADDNGNIELEVEENVDDTYYEGLQLESVAGVVTLELMGDDTANFIQVAEGGVLTGEGTATIEAEALTGTVPAASVGADHVNDIGEIDAGIKRGPDATDTHLLTTDVAAPVGSAECLEMDTDGSVILAGGACGVAGGDDITAQAAFGDPVNPIFNDTASVAVDTTDAAPDTITWTVLPAGVSLGGELGGNAGTATVNATHAGDTHAADDLTDDLPTVLSNVTTMTDGSYCQGNAGGGFDCDVATLHPFDDATAIVEDGVDGDKELRIDVGSNAAGVAGTLTTAFTVARVIALPDVTDTLASNNNVATMTNKNMDYQTGTSAPNYPRLAQSTTPPSAGCDNAAEVGRLYMDTDEDTDGAIMLCDTGPAWKVVGGGGGGFTSFDVAGDDGAPNVTITNGNTLTVTGGTNISTEDGDAGADTLTVDLDLTGITDTQALYDSSDQLGSMSQLTHDGTNVTLDLVSGDVAEATLQIDEVYNNSGATIHKCAAVYVSGFNVGADLPEISVADADTAGEMPALGLVQADISNASAGFVVTSGMLASVDTAVSENWTGLEGDPVYVANDNTTTTDGNCDETLTKTRPSGATDGIQSVARIARVNATTGALIVTGAGRSNDVPNLLDGNLWVGNATNVATSVTMGGDVLMTNAGVVTIQASAISGGSAGKLTDDSVTMQDDMATFTVAQLQTQTSDVTTFYTEDTVVPIVDGGTGAGSLANLIGNAEMDATLTDCNVLYAPSAEVALTDDVESVFRASAALTITEVWCETDTGTVNMDVQIDDGTPADVMGADLVCASTAVSDSTGLTGGMADGDTLDWAITSVATNPTRLTVCIEYDFD